MDPNIVSQFPNIDTYKTYVAVLGNEKTAYDNFLQDKASGTVMDPIPFFVQGYDKDYNVAKKTTADNEPTGIKSLTSEEAQAQQERMAKEAGFPDYDTWSQYGGDYHYYVAMQELTPDKIAQNLGWPDEATRQAWNDDSKAYAADKNAKNWGFPDLKTYNTFVAKYGSPTRAAEAYMYGQPTDQPIPAEQNLDNTDAYGIISLPDSADEAPLAPPEDLLAPPPVTENEGRQVLAKDELPPTSTSGTESISELLSQGPQLPPKDLLAPQPVPDQTKFWSGLRIHNLQDENEGRQVLAKDELPPTSTSGTESISELLSQGPQLTSSDTIPKVEYQGEPWSVKPNPQAPGQFILTRGGEVAAAGSDIDYLVSQANAKNDALGITNTGYAKDSAGLASLAPAQIARDKAGQSLSSVEANMTYIGATPTDNGYTLNQNGVTTNYDTQGNQTSSYATPIPKTGGGGFFGNLFGGISDLVSGAANEVGGFVNHVSDVVSNDPVAKAAAVIAIAYVTGGASLEGEAALTTETMVSLPEIASQAAADIVASGGTLAEATTAATEAVATATGADAVTASTIAQTAGSSVAQSSLASLSSADLATMGAQELATTTGATLTPAALESLTSSSVLGDAAGTLATAESAPASALAASSAAPEGLASLTGGATGTQGGLASINEMVASGAFTPGSAGAMGAATSVLSPEALAAAYGAAASGAAPVLATATQEGLQSGFEGGADAENVTNGGLQNGFEGGADTADTAVSNADKVANATTSGGTLSQAVGNEAVASGTFTPGSVGSIANAAGVLTPTQIAAASGLASLGTLTGADAAAANLAASTNQGVASGTFTPGSVGAEQAASGALTAEQLAAAAGTANNGINLLDAAKKAKQVNDLLNKKPTVATTAGTLGLAGLLAATNKNKTVDNNTYTGTIPTYSAFREQLPISQTRPGTDANPYRPGQGGITYFTPTTFTKYAEGGQVSAGMPYDNGNMNYPSREGGSGYGGEGMIGQGGITPQPELPQLAGLGSLGGNALMNQNINQGMQQQNGIYGSYGGASSSQYPNNSIPNVNQPNTPNPNSSQPNVNLANGGVVPGQYNLGSYSDGGRLLKGPGDGVSDSIPAIIGQKQPARLANGEFVIPARIVSELGNGSTDAGAKRLYEMMDRIQQTRRKTKNVAANTNAAKYLPA